jgi:hypothetical protein
MSLVQYVITEIKDRHAVESRDNNAVLYSVYCMSPFSHHCTCVCLLLTEHVMCTDVIVTALFRFLVKAMRFEEMYAGEERKPFSAIIAGGLPLVRYVDLLLSQCESKKDIHNPCLCTDK